MKKGQNRSDIGAMDKETKELKIKIKYRYGQLPEGLCELLNNADEADMRILVALMMLADEESG